MHAVRTQVRKLGATKVLIVRQSLEDPLSKTRYFGSTLLEADTQTILEVLAKRWAVEVLFEDAKDLLGSDHYQVMRSVAVERFWTLVFCLGYFLDEQLDKLQAVQPQVRVTWGDARRSLKHTQQLNLLIWLQKRFQDADSPQDLYDRLVA